MNRKLYTILTVLLLVTLTASPAYAGAIRLSGASASLGSLILKGTATGLGNTDWVFELDGQGHASTVCTNKGGTAAPGQNYPRVDRTGSQLLAGDSQLRKNGKSPFNVETLKEDPTNTIVPWNVAGCPNSNWTARIDFVFWDSATLYGLDPVTNSVAATFKFTCKTTRTGPNSTPSTFDDGTVTCTQQ